MQGILFSQILEDSILTDTKEDKLDLYSSFWIPKLHNWPYKERYIASSSRSSTKLLSKLLTTVLLTVKEGLQKHCDKAYSTGGVNQMWLLKNSMIFNISNLIL